MCLKMENRLENWFLAKDKGQAQEIVLVGPSHDAKLYGSTAHVV